MATPHSNSNEISYQGIYPTVFKKIDISDVSVNPFKSYKQWTLPSGSSTSSLLPLVGIYSDVQYLPALGTELTLNDVSNIDGSLQTLTYFSINHLFYKYKESPYKTYGPTNLNQTKKALFQSASIFSIPQIKIGEGIKPATFTMQLATGSLQSNKFGNIYNSVDTSSFASNLKYYEGFNEYFDTTRVNYESANVTYIPGVTTTTGAQLPIGYAAKFSGAYIKTTIDGMYNRDNDYAISFFISASNTGSTQLILTKSTSSIAPQYPFKIELDSTNKLIFSIAGTTTFKTQITSSAISTDWAHVVCQKTGSSLQLYVNGTLQASAVSQLINTTYSPFSASARIDNTDPLLIGGFNSQTSNLQGVLDELRIFNSALSTSNISSLKDRTEGGTLLQTNVVGTIFNKQGLGVISSADYRYNNIINNFQSITYRSTVTIHELGVVTKLDAGDFNMSTNLSLTTDNDTTYQSFVTSSAFAPYITCIGLYNDFGQLLAIGKLAQPIRKRDDVDMNFLIRIDLDKNISFKG